MQLSIGFTPIVQKDELHNEFSGPKYLTLVKGQTKLARLLHADRKATGNRKNSYYNQSTQNNTSEGTTH